MAAERADDGAVSLPVILPIFPLTGSLLLPGNFMPLNVFEPRYRNMVEDALGEGGHIGMIQPLLPGPDQMGLGEADRRLYSVGCAGRLEQAERQDDGRFLILLHGVGRFQIAEELALRRGYRRVRADYTAFAEDLYEEVEGIDTAALLVAVERFGHRRDLAFDMDLLASLEPPRLVNALGAALPFAPAEQQALLEAPTAADRGRLLLELMRMGESPQVEAPSFAPPTVN